MAGAAASVARWVIITGHSRGMGEAMAAQCLAQGAGVIGISRGLNSSLAEAAQHSGAPFQQWQCDLTDGTAAAERLSEWLAQLDPKGIRSIALINNAALLSTIQPLHTVAAPSLVSALRVGLEAPVLLTQAFLAGTQRWVLEDAWAGDRRVLQISSGLGRSAMASVGSYCAIKAGLDNFTASVALDQQQLGAVGAKVVSLAPGIIATDMQVQLRTAAAEDFPDQDKFRHFHASGALDSPSEAAQKVLAFLAREDFGEVVIADVRD